MSTYKTLRITNMQGFLQNIWEAITEQKLQAVMLDEGIITASNRRYATCSYRIPDHPGCGCAIGVNIPDDIYNERMEGRTVFSLTNNTLVRSLNLPVYISIHDAEMAQDIDSIQRLHDTWVYGKKGAKENFIGHLRTLSLKYGGIEIPSEYRE